MSFLKIYSKSLKLRVILFISVLGYTVWDVNVVIACLWRDRCCISTYIYQQRKTYLFPLFIQKFKKMLLNFLLALSFSLRGLAYAGNKSKTDTGTKVGLLKSLIYDNAKATVTLDSAALKQLIQLSSDNCKSKIKSNLKVIL